MALIADQSQQDSGKRIVNFYIGNEEKEKSVPCAFFKKGAWAKSLLSSHLRIEKQQRRRLDL